MFIFDKSIVRHIHLVLQGVIIGLSSGTCVLIDKHIIWPSNYLGKIGPISALFCGLTPQQNIFNCIFLDFS